MAYAFGRNLLLSSVGFERLIDAFQQLETGDPSSRAQTYPPYNIVKQNEHDYLIEIAVAGFQQEDISITAEGNKLSIEGKVQNSTQGDYLHKGIATRDFTQGLSDKRRDAGMDVKWGVTPALTADFSINTDFAQEEADVQQVNLTRFNLFFPEKRVAHFGDLVWPKAVPVVDGESGGSALALPDTLAKAVAQFSYDARVAKARKAGAPLPPKPAILV